MRRLSPDVAGSRFTVRACRPHRGALLASIVAIIAAGWNTAAADIVRHSMRVDAGAVTLDTDGGATSVRMHAAPRTWDADRPELPYVTVTLLVPRNSKVVALRARTGAERLVGAGLRLANAAPLVAEDGTRKNPGPERTRAAVAAVMPHGAAGASYPAVRAEIAGDGALHGYRMVNLRVHPVRWEVDGGRIWVAERVDLELELAPDSNLPIERERWRPQLEASARDILERLIANREALDGYDRRIGAWVERPPGFQPTDAPSLEGSDVDYVIITTDALAPSYQVLADWKTRRGIPAVVRTVEWIQANYRRGSDLQETIRTFIQDAYSKWGVQYVVLGGDTDLLPARYGYSEFGPVTERRIPTDLYFGCLDGNWNLDGDGLFGEAAVSMGPAGDSPDLYAEVYVGRIPFSTTSKIATYITKLIAYENPVQTAYQNNVLLLGEVLFPVDWTTGQQVALDGASICQELADLSPGCVSLKKLYENNTPYAGSQLLTRSATLTEMDAGPGLVNHVGHGYRYNMSCGDLSLQNSHALALQNINRRFVLYMLNCTATAFDFPCLGEAYLESAGGAVAVLGSTRAAYALPARPYNVNFFSALYQKGFANIGVAQAESRLPMTGNTLYDTADHYTHFLYNLLGDPEMQVHSCTLGTTTVNHPNSIVVGLTNVNLQVNVGGSPAPGVRVCLQKGVEEYEIGFTNGSGNVTLPILAETTGSMTVTASGANMTTYLGSITVNTAVGAYVATTAVTIDDDNSGSSSGNSDGVLDAGETLELAVTFRNSGGGSAASPNGKLRIPSPWVTVLDSTYSLSTLGAGASTSSSNQVYFSVSAGAPDATVLPLTFVTTSGANTWTDVVLRTVHAPHMELTRLDVDDFSPGGNGDGIIQAGETFDLVTYFKNYGTGAADGLAATLTTMDPDVVLTNGSITLGRANPLQQVTGATRFRLRENVLAENTMTVTLSDGHGRNTVVPITLREPAPPATPVLDASTGATVVIATWTPNLEVDLAGYHLYRATSAGGPWTRTTIDRTVRIAAFRDVGLQTSTRYYYYATAVDYSGNESAASSTASISTNPNQLTGWPIELASSSSCPPAVGDITGNGSKEIVAGNSHLYVWTASGNELRDDDADPQTWGVFATEVNTITGAAALGEVDRTVPGFEVFVASWDDTNKVFVFRGDGSIQSGWPQNPDPASAQKGYWANVTAVDVDGDARAELFAAAKNGNLYAWRWNGTPLVGSNAAFKTGLGTYSRSAPSIANVDADPAREIIYGAPNGTLYIWKPDGTNYGAFPMTPGTECLSNTAVGDVNDDGRMDVVMITEGGAVNVYDTKTGAQLAGFPQAVIVDSEPKTPSPALADFEFDGKLEIVAAVNYLGQCTIRIYDWQGNVRPGWPKVIGSTSESSPIVADFSGDGVPDVLFGGEGGLLYGWDKNGIEIPGFPLSVGDFIRSVPFADDVDGDGDIDLVLSGWDKNVYIWDFQVPYVKLAAQWPTLSHDAQRSGYYDHHIVNPTDTEPGPERSPAAPPARPYLAQNLPNPFNPTTSIAYGVAGTAAADVALDVYDVRGRHVRALVRATQAPGTYRAIWDGRDHRGQLGKSGVYFVRLRIETEVFTRKMLLLK